MWGICTCWFLLLKLLHVNQRGWSVIFWKIWVVLDSILDKRAGWWYQVFGRMLERPFTRSLRSFAIIWQILVRIFKFWGYLLIFKQFFVWCLCEMMFFSLHVWRGKVKYLLWFYHLGHWRQNCGFWNLIVRCEMAPSILFAAKFDLSRLLWRSAGHLSAILWLIFYRFSSFIVQEKPELLFVWLQVFWMVAQKWRMFGFNTYGSDIGGWKICISPTNIVLVYVWLLK